MQTQSLPAKGAKGALAAGQDDDLHIPCLPVQRVEHPLDPVVIGKDQRVVQGAIPRPMSVPHRAKAVAAAV